APQSQQVRMTQFASSNFFAMRRSTTQSNLSIMKIPSLISQVCISVLSLVVFATPMQSDKAFHQSELLFPLEHWHNHASCIVEAPNGDLLVCWFHGSGERQADDVKIEGARKPKGSKAWSPRFTMADTPGYPDTNCTMFVDPQNRLWLLW